MRLIVAVQETNESELAVKLFWNQIAPPPLPLSPNKAQCDIFNSKEMPREKHKDSKWDIWDQSLCHCFNPNRNRFPLHVVQFNHAQITNTKC